MNSNALFTEKDFTRKIGDALLIFSTINRAITINQFPPIVCTKIEYQIMWVLSDGQPITESDLARAIFDCTPDSSAINKLSKHIEHLRAKLRDVGIPLYISRIREIDGYFLVVSKEIAAV